jgi:hypothetical protein
MRKSRALVLVFSILLILLATTHNISYFLLTSLANPEEMTLNSPSSGSTITRWTVGFKYTPTVPESIKNASLWLNLRGTWQRVQWNSVPVQNGAENTISYTFESEGTYLWNIQVYGVSGTYWVASSNWRVTIDVPPRYQNVGSNTATISPGGCIHLYGQAYDDIGLSHAWLWTNETGGSGKNYSVEWTIDKYAHNPIYDENGANNVRWPVVQYDGSTYFLFYSHSGGVTDAYYATSTDGINFTYQGYAIKRSVSEWDSGYIEVHSVFRYNSTHWIMYYCGNPIAGYWSIGCAFSPNLKDWTKYSVNPILFASVKEVTVADPCVVKLSNGAYYMYYACYDASGIWQISKATSSNGLGWVKYSGNPVVTKKAGTWYSYYVACTEVREVNNKIQLLVIGNDGAGHCQLGLFESDLNGPKFSEALTSPSNPCLPNVAGTWEGMYTNHADFENISGSTYIYYNGWNGTAWQLGRATMAYSGMYDSPLWMNNTANQWLWSYFTWRNDSISGKTIQWRIYYQDIYGSINATPINAFYITQGDIPIDISPRNIAVSSVSLSKTVVSQGTDLHMNVTVINRSVDSDTFNVTAYANDTIIETRAVTLASGNSTILTFTWNTSGFAKGNYTISAYAWPVEGETNTEDNRLTSGQVRVVTPGNVNGDEIVNMQDIYMLILQFLHEPGDSCCSANCDIDSDGLINMKDIYIAIIHFMQTEP